MVRLRTGRTLPGLLVALLLSSALACGAGEPAPAGVSPSTAASRPATATPATAATVSTAEPQATNTSQATAAVAVEPTVSAPAGPTATPVGVVLPTPRPITQTPPPVRLRIPALGIDANVQWVGVDSDGRMAVPSNYSDVAWYEGGVSPGTPGNAVIAGHLDSTTGPAVFFKLEDLEPGDEILVASQDGQETRFIVISSEVYDADDAPLERIFGSAVRPQLNLITCDGAFDRSQRQYDKRLVVYTRIADDA